MIVVEAIVSALVGMATEGVISRAKEKVNLFLKEKGVDVPPINSFEGVYIHTLIEFSDGKPPAAVELFKHEFIQNAFRKAYEQNNTSFLIAEIEHLIDWHAVGESFQYLDISPQVFVEEFAGTFHSVVDRTRTPYQIREEGQLKSLAQSSSQITEQLSEISSQLKYVVESRFDESDVVERIYTDRIEQARKLVKEGQSITGQEILKALERELEGKEVSQKLRFELYTNIASAHLHLEEYEDACRYLETALILNQNDPKALANAALAALLRANNLRAIELAERSLELDKNQTSALSVMIQASERENIELSDPIKQQTRDYPETRRILAILSFEAKDLETAEKLYRENLAAPNADVQDSVLLAQTLLASAEAEFSEGTHFFALPKIVQERLIEAEQLLLNSKEKWEKDDNRRRFANTLGLLVQVQSLQHKNDQVWNHCQQILLRFPNDYPALFHAGLIEFSRRNYKKAITYFEKALAVQDLGDRRDRVIPLATAYLLERQYNKVISLLQNDIPTSVHRANVERVVLLAKAYWAVKDKNNADRMVGLLQSSRKDDPYVLEGLAQVQIEFGELASAYSNLDAAYQQANEFEKSYFAILLAEFHYNHGEFAKAISLYEASFVPDKDIPVINHYLISLLNAGYYEKANSLAKSFRAENTSNPVFTVIEARIAEYIGELEHAKKLYLDLNDLQPENPEHLIRAALMDYRRGKSTDAFMLLKLNIDKFWNSPKELMTIAQIGASAKIDAMEILEYAYRARRLGVNDPDIHLAYVGLFFSQENSLDQSLNPDMVRSGVAVFVRTDRETTKWYTILDDEPLDKGRGEIATSDLLAQKLMGLQKGGSVLLREGYYEHLEFTVIEVQSKYVRALQETLNEFGSLFPENLSIQMIKVEDSDPTKMVAMSARQNQIVQVVHDYYLRENLTIGQFSKLIGRSQISTWTGLISSNGIVKVSTGTPEDQEIDTSCTVAADNITVELTGILTLTNSNQLDLLSKRFENIYIAQTVLDIVVQEIGAEQNLLKDHLSIEHNHDQMVVREIKASQISRNTEVLEGLQKFIIEKCTIAPVILALKLGKEKYEALANNFSPSAIDSILIAKETASLLYSDDMILRGFAKREFEVNGTWTQPVLKDCSRKGLLEEDSYSAAVASLVFTNYHFISINNEILKFFLRKNNWSVTREAARLFDVLAGPYTTIDSALNIATALTKDVWSERLMLHQKTAILDLLLSSLAKNRLSIAVIRLFVNHIQRLFTNSFTPWYADEIIRQTEAWLQTHLSLNQKSLLL